MLKRTALFSGSLLLSLGLALAAPAAFAQTTPATPAAPAASPQSAILAAAAVVPKPKSKAEVKALQNLQKMSTSDTVTSDQMDAALTNFATQFPSSEYLGVVASYGLRFYQTPPHQDYEKSLLYGEQTIQHEPVSVYALATVSTIIAQHISSTDLDYAQRKAEAEKDANTAVAVANTVGAKINGVPFPDSAKSVARSMAYAALAQLAVKDKDYGAAVNDYKQAVQNDPSPYSKASDYFYMARAQIAGKQYAQALDSLNQALQADPSDPNIQAAVASNKKVVAELEKQGGGK
ncbi:MAG: tetratricopeptide repeat protein [Acidobacteria bacterium]|nr:MAG: tetratricopeptide repeat protein [Acidobacteriota bacterium]